MSCRSPGGNGDSGGSMMWRFSTSWLDIIVRMLSNSCPSGVSRVWGLLKNAWVARLTCSSHPFQTYLLDQGSNAIVAYRLHPSPTHLLSTSCSQVHRHLKTLVQLLVHQDDWWTRRNGMAEWTGRLGKLVCLSVWWCWGPALRTLFDP